MVIFRSYVELAQGLLPNQPVPGPKDAVAEEVVEAIVQVDLRAGESPVSDADFFVANMNVNNLKK